MRIGIELNGIVRDINKQVVKYYKKDIDKSFNDKDVDLNVLNVIDHLDFKRNKDRFEFMYVDYPYEVFGCAQVMTRNLSVMINNWIYALGNEYGKKYDIKLFSLKEEGLSIQSTYYFLSKIGCRVRKMFFPKDGKDMWDECDVIITTNERIVKNKPKGKVVVLIKKSDNLKLVEDADMSYDELINIITDADFLSKVKTIASISRNKKCGIIKKIKNLLYAKEG